MGAKLNTFLNVGLAGTVICVQVLLVTGLPRISYPRALSAAFQFRVAEVLVTFVVCNPVGVGQYGPDPQVSTDVQLLASITITVTCITGCGRQGVLYPSLQTKM